MVVWSCPKWHKVRSLKAGTDSIQAIDHVANVNNVAYYYCWSFSV